MRRDIKRMNSLECSAVERVPAAVANQACDQPAASGTSVRRRLWL